MAQFTNETPDMMALKLQEDFYGRRFTVIKKKKKKQIKNAADDVWMKTAF